jgi:hypothetical protein
MTNALLEPITLAQPSQLETSSWKDHSQERLKILLEQVSALVTVFGNEVLFSHEGVREFQRVGCQSFDDFGAFFEEPWRILRILEQFDTSKGDLFAYLKAVAKKDRTFGEIAATRKAIEQANHEQADAFQFESGEERSVQFNLEQRFDPASKLEQQEDMIEQLERDAHSKEILEALPKNFETWVAQASDTPKMRPKRLRTYHLVHQRLIEQAQAGKATRTLQGSLSLGAGMKERIAQEVGVSIPTSRGFIADFQSELEKLREQVKNTRLKLGSNLFGHDMPQVSKYQD